jgi:alpha-L-rhamnosidase
MVKHFLVGLMMIGSLAPAAWALSAGELKCEFRTNPLGIDSPHPRLSWILTSPARADVQSAYQIVVSGDAGTLWDSGKVASDESANIEYAGQPLAPGARLTWCVRAWDREDRASAWSEPATFTMGLLEPADWKGKWIAAKSAHPDKRLVNCNGYHAMEAKRPDEPKWVQVDLGRSMPIRSVKLHPALPNNFHPATPGFGFPVRFEIRASDDPSFGSSTAITSIEKDLPNPGNTVVAFATGVNARYVRVSAEKLYRRPDGVFCFALAEMEVICGDVNAALGRAVTAKDSIERDDWHAAALTDGRSPQAPADPDEFDAPMFRKRFAIDKPLRRAIASVCGLGYCELSLNGAKVGDHVLDPGFTRFDRRVLYDTYDVTSMLRPGENEAQAILGGGWYDLATPDLFGFEAAPWTAPPKLLMQIDCEFEDGSRKMIATDGSWQTAGSPITFNCVRGGETIDLLRAARPPTWKPVTLVAAPAGKLVAQPQPAIEACGEIPAVELTEPRPHVYVYKLRENTAGWARFRTSGTPGQKITLKFRERLNPDGTVSDHNSSHTHGRFATGELILAGRGVETYEPRFTYYGFQYVQVEGLTHKPALDDLAGVAVHTALAPAGKFSCSNETLNAIDVLARRTYLNNLHSIPTDCPHREKMGWFCDGAVTAPMAMFAFDAPLFYEKWAADMRDAQAPDGSMPVFAPTDGWGESGHEGAGMQCPWWGGACIVVPWTLYQRYGDVRILAQQYDTMRGYVDSLKARAKDDILIAGLGDWLEVGADTSGLPTRTPIPLTSTAAYAHLAGLVSSAASLLGKDDDAVKYSRLHDDIRAAFNRKFFNAATAGYAPDSQTAAALALDLNLAPRDQTAAVLEGLVKNIQGPRHGHLSTGLVGTSYLMDALRAWDRDDLALEVITARGYPGFVDMMSQGATTMWEDWGGHASHDHPAFGSVGSWFYQSVAGIRPDPRGPGFKKIIIKPAMAGDLTWAKGSYDSIRGRIESAWKIQGDRLSVQVTIPMNTNATVWVPSAEPDKVSEADGAKPARLEKHFAVYKLGGGSYAFEAPRSTPP